MQFRENRYVFILNFEGIVAATSIWYFLYIFLSLFWWFISLFCYNVIWNSATSISCYVCNATDSSSPFQCGEWFERYDTPDIVPQDCSNVYGAKYCVKHIGRFEGKCSWSTNNDLLLIHGYMGLVWSGLSGNTNKHVFLSFHIYSFIIYIFFLSYYMHYTTNTNFGWEFIQH